LLNNKWELRGFTPLEDWNDGFRGRKTILIFWDESLVPRHFGK